MFGQRLNQTRKIKGYTAQQMADILSVTLRTYRNYESDTTFPAPNLLVLIADSLEVSVDYLLGRTENPLMNTK